MLVEVHTQGCPTYDREEATLQEGVQSFLESLGFLQGERVLGVGSGWSPTKWEIAQG